MDIALVLTFLMGGIAVLILGWASPIPTSYRIMPTAVGAIGLSVLHIYLYLQRPFNRRIN